MIGVTIQESETIDRALKRFKKKFDRSGILREFRARTAFIKPSIVSRQSRLRAIKKQHRANRDANL
ncbi:MAG: 30S ribosomal protein S21 [Chlorobiota bacterium]|jgi:small subunit ribosomal protein S21|nr:30S ribosomal protein S21 [Chlorobiota bacterium]QQS67420.1 MAG: 30S ribosomal protein S21 [Chlorobiota bacterium]